MGARVPLVISSGWFGTDYIVLLSVRYRYPCLATTDNYMLDFSSLQCQDVPHIVHPVIAVCPCGGMTT